MKGIQETIEYLGAYEYVYLYSSSVALPGKPPGFCLTLLLEQRDRSQLVIDVQIVSALIAAAEKKDPELRKEATWGLSNLCAGATPEQMWVLVQLGVLACLCGILAGEDQTLMVVALEAINNVFKKSEDDTRICRVVEGVGGLKTLRNLQTNDQGEVAKLAKYIVVNYFDGDDDDDEKEDK
ncbi:hypothetical protein SK128_000116 [Halocaridina rubra]|uniref:Uncharacterized protein n=1 Tax=Halocaridina rubra TaxID=373956 RepID=A0AAN8X5X6_HALRR